jgi:hypothetical protein
VAWVSISSNNYYHTIGDKGAKALAANASITSFDLDNNPKIIKLILPLLCHIANLKKIIEKKKAMVSDCKKLR